MEIVSAENSR